MGTCKTNFYRIARIRLKFSESMEDISYSTQSMFWGVVLKPEKRYEQAVEDPFHISKACLEPTSIKDGKNSITSVYIEVDDEEFLLCNLSDKVLNESLDLNFNTGDKLVFKTSGPGVIHLTGYNVEVPDEDDEFDYEGESEEEESEEESVDEAPQLVNGKKRKMNDSLTDVPNKKKEKLSPLDKLLADAKKAKPGDKKEEVKKAAEMQKKIAQAMAKREEESDDDDDDDEDGEEEESDDDDDLLDGEAEEGDEDEEDGEEEEEEESEDEEMETDAKPQINGSPKKQMNGEAKKATPEKSPQSTPDSGDKKKKKKNKKKNKNKNKDAEATTEAGDAKTPAKDQKAKTEQKTPAKAEQKTPAKAEQKTPGKDAKKTPGGKTPKRTLKGGIQVEDLKEGNGPEAKRGKMVGMYYEGKLKSNGKTFDKNLGGKPFKFRLGAGEVIKGWDVGVDGMKVGGKRRLTIPASFAYGKQGAAPEIPPNATLVFDVECKAVN